MAAGSRYTATTLTNYVVVALGILLAFQTVGLDWSSSPGRRRKRLCLAIDPLSHMQGQ
jgi:hypothetical protein